MDIKLGLCNPPEPIYLYVRSGEEKAGTKYLWYKYDIESQQTIPVHEKGLTGHLQELRLTSKLYKGKENMKLEIVVSADETYIMRTGLETNFAKTFLLSLTQVQDFTHPLIFSVAPGNENVVFCRLYDAITRQRIKATWDSNADWASIIHIIQQKLGQTNSPVEFEPTEQQVPTLVQDTQLDNTLLRQEINSLAKRKNLTPEQISIGAFKYFGAALEQMNSTELLAYRDRLQHYQVAAPVQQ